MGRDLGFDGAPPLARAPFCRHLEW
uniref:Uncharacterized protein n=1 Tax=Arundo donax TaxID=35708 RepID=A0A0A8XZS7_ARUDO